MAGYHDNGGFDSLLDEFGKHLRTVHLRHFDVTEDGVIFFFFRFFKPLTAIFGRFYLVILHFQDFLQGIADGSFVVNYKNFHV